MYLLGKKKVGKRFRLICTLYIVMFYKQGQWFELNLLGLLKLITNTDPLCFSGYFDQLPTS